MSDPTPEPEHPSNSAQEAAAETTGKPVARKKATPQSRAGQESTEPAAEKKAPPIEAKPLPIFIEEHFFPALRQALANLHMTDVNLSWVPQLNQVRGSWGEGKHEFIITFTQGDLKGLKTFAYSSYGAPPSTLESFMIDERKVTLELLVFYTIQRLVAQKVVVLN
jgi:hypothetical protein